MPFKSKAQARYLAAKKPKVFKEFASETKSLKGLPERVKENSTSRMNRLIGGRHK